MTCSRRWAATLATMFMFAVALASWGVTATAERQQPERKLGYGQVKFNGLGAERWAQRWRREHRLVEALRDRLTRRLAPLVWLVDAFGCIHQHEGSWTDTGAPYYGGLQMDYRFMQTYAPDLLHRKGTADRWTPAEQIGVAIVAYLSGRGFGPWPNTARMCGLR